MAKVIDEQLGNLSRRLLDLERRVLEGTLPFQPTMDALQAIIEGRGFNFFPTWKTVKLGGTTVETLRTALENVGFGISKWAGDILRKVDVAAEESTVELVRVKVRDLGFTGEPMTSELFNRERLAAYGLDLCPAEVGPQLRLAYDNQPKDEGIVVAMEPITDSDGDPVVFRVNHDIVGQRLCARYAHLERRWNIQRVLVFVRRK